MKLKELALFLVFMTSSSRGAKHVIPGEACGTTNPFRSLDSIWRDPASPKMSCVLFKDGEEYQTFLEYCFQNWIEVCREKFAEFELTDKDKWRSHSISVHQDNHDAFDPRFAHDGIVRPGAQYSFTSSVKHGFMQIALPRAHHVSRLFLELRPDSCCGYNNAFIEARVGMVDTAAMELQLLTVNQVCYEGDELEEVSKNYECSRPLWGKYLTLQKAKWATGFGMVINEVYVFVVRF